MILIALNHFFVSKYHLKTAIVFLLFLFESVALGQSVQDFGTTTGSLTTGNSSSFLPNPTSFGTTYARIGSGGGSINKVTTSNPLGTSDTYIRAVASSNASVCKISPIIASTSGTTFYSRFKILFGDVSAGSTATSGDWYAFLGDGAMFGDNNGFSGAQTFAGLRFRFGAGGDITFNNRNGSAWSQTGINSTFTTLNSGIYYDFEIIGNNKSSGIESYTYNEISQSVAVNTFDLYINGVQVGNDVAKAQLPNNNPIKSNMFYGESSTSNVANIFLDDVTFQNSRPSVIQRLSDPSTFDLATANFSFTNWPATSRIGSYPSNMVFHWGIVSDFDPVLSNTATQDFVWGYNYAAQSRINGLDANGFSFLNTNPGHVSATSGNCGEAVLGLNTIGRGNIQVSWLAARQSDNGNRYNVRGQYRIGNSGSYTDLPGVLSAIEFNSSISGPVNFGPITLPISCENQSEVQIRWVYYWTNSGSGARDEIRIDDIFITSIALLPIITSTTPGAICNAGSVTLGATASSGTINWYANLTGGSSLGTGTSFLTPSISLNTTYYVDATSGANTSSPRTAVTTTVYAPPQIIAISPP